MEVFTKQKKKIISGHILSKMKQWPNYSEFQALNNNVHNKSILSDSQALNSKWRNAGVNLVIGKLVLFIFSYNNDILLVFIHSTFNLFDPASLPTVNSAHGLHWNGAPAGSPHGGLIPSSPQPIRAQNEWTNQAHSGTDLPREQTTDTGCV